MYIFNKKMLVLSLVLALCACDDDTTDNSIGSTIEIICNKGIPSGLPKIEERNLF